MAVIYFAMAVVVINIFTPAIIFRRRLLRIFLCSYLLTNILAQCEPREDTSGQE